VITLEQAFFDQLNRMITLTDEFCYVIFSEWHL